jgi:methyl-accepting chemotaxis protein
MSFFENLKLNNFKIGTRIIVALALPVVGLLVFSGLAVFEKSQVSPEMTKVNKLATLAPTIDALVHKLHKERDMSAGFSEISTAIASALVEQEAAAQEIARNIQQAAAGATEVTENIFDVNQAASESGTASGQALSSAGELSEQSEPLRNEVQEFLEKIRAV